MLVESISAFFVEFKFLIQTDHFGKAIAFAKWLIFKMVSFLQYLRFFERSFAHNYFKVLVESISACFLEF